MIRIVIGETLPLMQDAYRLHLNADVGMEVVGTATRADHVVAMYERHRPDLVLCDAHLDDSSGTDAVQGILAVNPDARVVMVSADVTLGTVEAALQAGAKGYIDKRVTASELHECIQTALDGSLAFDRRTSADYIMGMVKKKAEGDLAADSFTPRELEVLALMAEGLTYPEIGRKLFISTKTSRTHAANAMKKLGVSNRTRAVYTAVQHGIIS